jgi:hypothetical protein
MSYLLDKNISRYALTGLRYRHLRPLSPPEKGALSFWHLANLHQTMIFISYSSFEVLRRMPYSEAHLLLDDSEVLWPTRYHTRWARRIQQVTGLTREDAAVIALATFGTTSFGDLLGAHWVLTYDRAMINGYLSQLSTLERRLQAMAAQLSPPFNQVTLPRLATPDEILSTGAI